MIASPISPTRRVAGFFRKPVVLRSIVGMVAVVALYGLLGRFVLPGIIQSQVQQLIAEKLHRQAHIGKVEVQPFALTLTVRDFKMLEPQGETVFASFDALHLDVSGKSLLRLAPVVQQVRLDKPYVHLARTAAHAYNIDDILALANQPAPEPQKQEGPARFAVYNIQVEDGRIAFEDRPAGATHTVDALRIGVPFISSLHSQVEVFVEPLLSARVNGAPLLLKGKARPFADTREAVLALDLDDLDLTRFVDYLPFKPAFKLAGAQLDTRLVASFLQPHDQAPKLTLSGNATLKSLQLVDPGGKPFFKLPELRVTLDGTPLLGNHFKVARLEVNGLEADVTRDSRGQIDVQRLLAVASPPAANPETKDIKAPAVAKSAALQVTLDALAIRGATLRYIDQQPAAPLAAGVEKFDATLRKLALDTGTRRVAIEEIASGSAAFQIRHDKPQAGAVAPAAPTAPADDAVGKSPARASTVKDDGDYVVTVARVAIENWSAHLEDRSQVKPAVTVLAPVGLTMADLSTAPAARASVALKAGVNRGGLLALEGKLGMAPLHADLKLDLKEVDVLPLQPYITDKVNLLLTRASLSGKGALQLDQGSDGAFKGGYKGDFTLGNLATVDKLSGSDFLRWKSLYFGGVDARIAPLALTIDQIALSDFFARVIIDPSGRINLQDIGRGHPDEKRSLTERDGHATAPAPVEKAVTKAAPADTAAPVAKIPPIKVRKLTLQGGRVRFTDNFIKPNYTANLMGIGGVVQGLSSDPASSATVDLRGEVNSAPLTVVGSINPLKGDLAMDLKASVRDMELAPLSPYSGRYVGYGIEKGKLSFEVAYKVDQRQLSADNRLVLDQLTFGDKIESPNALNLPVQLAVALLRDRNGVIDLNLPLAGSLDDPQFSMGAIIVKVFVNLITKAVTAPFALLGSLFGGGEELSYMEFDPGRAAIPTAGETKLKSLARALADRPALKLEIAALTGADAEIEGMKRVAIERKVRALKLKELVARGESASAGGVVVKPEEYPALLKQVYKDEKFPKPRNLVGLQKDLPVVEMEKLMIANTQIDADALTALGNRRAQVVKEWLLKNGQIPGERIFILATKSAPGEAKEAGDGKDGKDGKGPGPSRVDFSLK